MVWEGTSGSEDCTPGLLAGAGFSVSASHIAGASVGRETSFLAHILSNHIDEVRGGEREPLTRIGQMLKGLMNGREQTITMSEKVNAPPAIHVEADRKSHDPANGTGWGGPLDEQQPVEHDAASDLRNQDGSIHENTLAVLEDIAENRIEEVRASNPDHPTLGLYNSVDFQDGRLSSQEITLLGGLLRQSGIEMENIGSEADIAHNGAPLANLIPQKDQEVVLQ